MPIIQNVINITRIRTRLSQIFFK